MDYIKIKYSKKLIYTFKLSVQYWWVMYCIVDQPLDIEHELSYLSYNNYYSTILIELHVLCIIHF